MTIGKIDILHVCLFIRALLKNIAKDPQLLFVTASVCFILCDDIAKSR